MPEYGSHLHIDNLRDYVTRSGSHFFDKDTMRFFRSRLDWHTYPGPDGWYFVTSEKHVCHLSTHTINEPRQYTVRCLRMENHDGTPGLELYELVGFQAFRSLNSARTAAKRAATAPASICPDCRLRLLRAWTPETRCPECQTRHARIAKETTCKNDTSN
jgi:hypothetical protein